NPGVVRLINNVIEQGHKHNIHVGMCGEMASEPIATLLLLGMGLNDFSMNAASIPTIKNIIVNNSITKARNIYKNVMEMNSSEKIIAYLQEAAQ
ncbi:MAG: ptsP, partial [Mucilaginibacter sp.]|nr:ptsP [Mucilaginibacter sp.]